MRVVTLPNRTNQREWTCGVFMGGPDNWSALVRWAFNSR